MGFLTVIKYVCTSYWLIIKGEMHQYSHNSKFALLGHYLVTCSLLVQEEG